MGACVLLIREACVQPNGMVPSQYERLTLARFLSSRHWDSMYHRLHGLSLILQLVE